MAVIGFSSNAAPLNNRVADSSSISKRNIAVSDLSSIMVAGSILLLSLMVVLKFVGVDKLLEAMVNILVEIGVNKLWMLETDKWIADRLAATL
ncbi:hypothetical protein G9A89_018881 [Geosiphon pyriformis]|nr:hypothetical protein G9A89_018881 [Geosiphon pyriformis]